MSLTTTETQDLDALLASKGWAILVAQARAECGVQKDKGMREALNVADDVGALHRLRQVAAFEAGVTFVLELPEQLIGQAVRGDKPIKFDPSRRGML